MGIGLWERSLDGVESIGVDEAQRLKGRKRLALAWQIDNGSRRLLRVVFNRTRKAFNSFFTGMEKARAGVRAGIKHIRSDMWKPHWDVAAKRIPNALNILDRFHVAQKFSKAIGRARAEEARRLKAGGKAPVFAKARWLFLKKCSELMGEERFRLGDLLRMNLGTVKAHLLSERFQAFWEL